MTDPTSSPTPAQQSPEADTWLGEKTRDIVSNALEGVYQLFCGVMGPFLGIIAFQLIQDTIGLSFIVRIPSLIGKFILGKDFSNYHICILEDAWGVSLYACFIITTLKFVFWILLGGRLISRLVNKNTLLGEQKDDIYQSSNH